MTKITDLKNEATTYTEPEWKAKYADYSGDGTIPVASVMVEWSDPTETPSECIMRLNNEVIANDHVKDLTNLRVSVARVAQAAGVSLHYVGLPDDAQFAAIDKAAKEKLRGWNSLCAAIVDAIVAASKTLTDAGHEIARLRKQDKPIPADVIADAIEALRRIERARDYNAEHGHYPPEYEIRNDVCFDDWAADIASTILGKLAKR